MLIDGLFSGTVLSIILLVGGVAAVLIAIIGKDQRSHYDEILAVIGFLIGAFMIFVGASIYQKSGWDQSSTMLIFISLGLGLFFRVFKRIRWASLISLIVGLVLGLILYNLSKSLTIITLSPITILVVVFVVMILVYIVLRALEGVIDFFGGVISFRPVLFFLGLLAVAESLMLLLGRPIQSFLTLTCY
ncbi:MAG: hypothetical protein QHH00_07915 [Methanomassiliicoccales archaeon]|jgi:hypothetical protein|nr:hypothetical protein [Methanomassiliicoccales archaeon]